MKFKLIRLFLVVLSFLLLIISIKCQNTCALYSGLVEIKLDKCSKVLPDVDKKLNELQVLDSFKNRAFISNIEVSGLQADWQRKNHWLTFELCQDFTKQWNVIVKFSDLQGVWLIENDSLRELEFAGFLPTYDSQGAVIFKDIHRFFIALENSKSYTILCKTYPKYFERGPSYPILSDAHVYEQRLQSHISITTFFNGLVIGLLLVFFTLALLVYIILKQKAYLFYTIYIFSVILYLWRDFEHLNYFYFSTMKYVEWHDTKMLIMAIVGSSYLLFLKYLLKTKLYYPKVNSIINVLLFIILIDVPIDYIGCELLDLWSYRLSMYFTGIIILISQILINVFFIGSKDSIARYVAIGSLFLGVGSISIPLFPIEIHTWVVRICFVLEMSAFTTAFYIFTKQGLKEKFKAEEDLKTNEMRHIYEMEKKITQQKILTADLIRKEISQDIHDEIGSELTKISLSAHLISRSGKIDSQDICEKVSKIGDDAIHANKQLRALLFSINPTYDDFDLIQAYFREFATDFWKESPMKLIFDFNISDYNPKMDRFIKGQLLLIYKEINTNIAKHAKASSIVISLNVISPSSFLLTVQDNGIGIELNRQNRMTNGLNNMSIRCDKIGAQLTIQGSLNEGTLITIEGRLEREIE